MEPDPGDFPFDFLGVPFWVTALDAGGHQSPRERFGLERHLQTLGGRLIPEDSRDGIVDDIKPFWIRRQEGSP
jgi:hypothetical protein